MPDNHQESWLSKLQSFFAKGGQVGRINQLTPRQEELLAVYREKWIAIALSAGKTDPTRANLAIDKVYQCVDFMPARIKLWVRDPFEGCLGAYLVSQLCQQAAERHADLSWGEAWNRVKEGTIEAFGKGVWDAAFETVWSSIRAQVHTQAGPHVVRSQGDPLWEEIPGAVWAGVKNDFKVKVWLDEKNQEKALINAGVVGRLREEISIPAVKIAREHYIATIEQQISDQLERLFKLYDVPMGAFTASTSGEDGSTEEESAEASIEWFPRWSLITDQLIKASSGAHKVYNLSFFDYLKEVCGQSVDILSGVWEAANECGWYWRLKGVTIMTPKPVSVSMSDGLLHHEGGPAITYESAFSVYAYKGIRLPEKIGKLPPSRWQAEWLWPEKNPDIRRALLMGIGYNRFLKESGGNELDISNNYHLVRIEQGKDILPTTLLMTSPNGPAPGMISLIPAHLTTVREALAWCQMESGHEKISHPQLPE